MGVTPFVNYYSFSSLHSSPSSSILSFSSPLSPEMFSCCAGTEEDYNDPTPKNQYGNNGLNDRSNRPGGGQEAFNRPSMSRSNAPPKILPIEIPAMSLEEVCKMTNNFNTKSLIGEGSYAHVFHGTLSSGEQVAIKKMDLNVSKESDAEFSDQVGIYICLCESIGS